MIDRINRLIKSLHFYFALFFYLFVALTVSYGFFALVLFAENNFDWPPNVLMIGSVVGIAVGALVVFLLSKIKIRLFSAHIGTFDLHPINIGFIVIVFLIGLGILLIAIVYASSNAEIKAVMKNLAEALLILGSITSIMGLFFAGHSIQQYRRQITSFSSFAKRLKHMIHETSGDTDDDYVRIMAYTPIPGSLALEERIYDDLRERIMNAETRLEIVCLDEDALSKWFDKFERKRYRSGQVTKEKIGSAKKDIEHLIDRIDNPDSPIKKLFAEKHRSKRLNAKQLPDYYFFFNDTRAIVTTPFFFPETPDNVDGDTNIEFEDEPVEMIGFETTDMKIIENIKKFYIRFRD